MIGIIYKYTSPSGKVYIGQTLDETRRRNEFLDLSVKYAGKRIENARIKYGPDNFIYEILEKKQYDTIENALYDLNIMESYYIGKFDSYYNGYNMTYGGEGVRGNVFDEETKNKISKTLKEYYKTHDNPFYNHKHTDETKKHLSEIARKRESSPFKNKTWNEKQRRIITEINKLNTGEKNPFYGKKHTEKTKKMISDANSVPVIQINPKTNEIIQRFSSAKAAGEHFGKPRANSEIIKVCKNYVSPSGRHYKTALGYKWKYEKDIEGSTTTETTEM